MIFALKTVHADVNAFTPVLGEFSNETLISTLHFLFCAVAAALV